MDEKIFEDAIFRQRILDIFNAIETWKPGSPENLWKALTKQMFRNKNAIEVFQMVENALYEVSNDIWEMPEEIFMERIIYPQSKGEYRKAVDNKIRISELARRLGLDVDKRGKCICPFHYDNNPSLKFNDEKNVFYCFGCHAKGDIIKFYQMFDEVKNGKKRGS